MTQNFVTRSQILKFLSQVIIALGIASCTKPDPKPQPDTPQQLVERILTSATWKLQSVAADGVDQTAIYSGFTIRFTSTTYLTTNGKAIWPARGTWKFDGSTTNIVRDDGLLIQIAADVSLAMTLTWNSSTLGSGKVSSTNGQYVFTMVK